MKGDESTPGWGEGVDTNLATDNTQLSDHARVETIVKYNYNEDVPERTLSNFGWRLVDWSSICGAMSNGGGRTKSVQHLFPRPGTKGISMKACIIAHNL